MRLTFNADFSLIICCVAGSFSQYTVAFTSIWSAKNGTSSETLPVRIFTTPPGRSELFNTSANVIADNGFNEDARTIHEFPPAMIGATTDTRPIRELSCGATAATTPVASGTEKLK